jgi:hypothetical protein
LRFAARRKFRDQRGAKRSGAAAAVFEKEEYQFAKAIQIGSVYDRAALSLAFDEARSRQGGKMRGHRVLGNVEQSSELARRHSCRFVPNEKPEGFKARCLGQPCEGIYG